MSSEDDIGLTDLPADLPALEQAFALSPMSNPRHLPDGWMNRNWKITSGGARFVLKRIFDVTPQIARGNFAALAFLAARSIPVCLPVPTVDGDTVAEVDGRAYCLVPWVDGTHRPGCELSLPAVARLGELVGHIHQALADLPDACLPPIPDTLQVTVNEAGHAAEVIGRVDRSVAAIADPIPYDITVRKLLKRRLELLTAHEHRQPSKTVPVGPFGRVHGDLNIRNLLFGGEEVRAVLDWDRMKVGAYAEEVVKTGLAMFAGENGFLDLERVPVFAAAYRAVSPLPGAALADAVTRLWWKLLTDLWPVEFRYLRGEPSERIASLFPPGEQTLEWWTAHLDEVLNAFVEHA